MKVILGIAAGYVLLLWALCAAVAISKSRTATFHMGALGPVVIFSAAVTTVAALTLIRRAWRREAGFVAAVLTSLVASAIVFWLLLGLLLGGD